MNLPRPSKVHPIPGLLDRSPRSLPIVRAGAERASHLLLPSITHPDETAFRGAPSQRVLHSIHHQQLAHHPKAPPSVTSLKAAPEKSTVGRKVTILRATEADYLRKEVDMGTVHTLHDAGTFLFRAGLVCRAQSRTAVVVHVNHETGQVCLPQAPCEWLHADPSRSGSAPGLESFTATADRLAASQLGLQATVRGYHVLDSAQPGCQTSVSKPPFLLDAAVSDGGTTKVTAWFLVGNAYCAEDEEVDFARVGGWERGGGGPPPEGERGGLDGGVYGGGGGEGTLAAA